MVHIGIETTAQALFTSLTSTATTRLSFSALESARLTVADLEPTTFMRMELAPLSSVTNASIRRPPGSCLRQSPHSTEILWHASQGIATRRGLELLAILERDTVHEPHV